MKQILTHHLTALSLLLIISLGALAYSNTLQHQFVWDDHDFLIRWDQIKDFSLSNLLSGAQPEFHSGVYRPLRTIFYQISYRIWGLNPTGYHFQALTLHLVISILVYLLSRQLTDNPTTAFLASLFFALHPIHTEAVAWVTASFDLFAILIVFGSFYFYLIHFRSSNHRFLQTSALLAFFSFFGNELALTIPFLILTHYLLFHPKPHKSLKTLLPFAFAFIFYWLIRMSHFSLLGRMFLPWSYADQLRLAPLVLGRYIKLFFLPTDLNINHLFAPNIASLFYLDLNQSHLPDPVSLTHPSLLLGLAFLLICYFLLFKKRRSTITFSFLWIIISLIPVMQFIPQPIIFSERYAYLASFGFVLLVAHLLQRLAQLLPRFKPLLLLVIASYSWALLHLTFSRNLYWHDNFTLFSHALTQNPQSASTLNSLGAALSAMGDYQQASRYAEAAIRLNPDLKIYYRNLFLFYQQSGQIDKMIAAYQNLIKLHPDDPEPYFSLGDIFFQLGQYPQAKNYYEQALQLQPNNPRILNQLIKLNQNRSINP